MDAFGSADRLAGYAGLAPAPRDSGRVSGTSADHVASTAGLLNAMYLSALSSLKSCPASKA
jgi:transposase